MAESKKEVERVRLLLAWSSAALVVAGICSLLGVGAVFGYQKLYEGRMYAGVSVAGVRVDGLTRTEARKVVQERIDQLLSKGLPFRFKGRDFSLDTNTVSTDADATRDLLQYDIDQAIDTAYAFGRSQDLGGDILRQVLARVHAHDVPPKVTLDRAAISDALHLALKDDLVSMRDAALDIRPTDPPTVGIRPEREGVALREGPALNELEDQALGLELHPITLRTETVEPTVRASDIESLKGRASEILTHPVPTFAYPPKTVLVPSVVAFSAWLVATSTSAGWDVVIDHDAFVQGLHVLAKDIEVEAKNGNLVAKDGKIESFVPGTQGVELEADAQYAQVIAQWPATTTFQLLTHTTRGTLSGEDPERLGIRELLGVGHSNFAGSPVNRRKNIALGVKKVDGTLIPAGTEFSMIKTLGAIDEAHGWFSELVIKGNETKPEFGGGLCQIGTTAFRGALASGVPITERRNHSYRVRYYEPAGTDATIYDPKPDFRFKNDTVNNILISGRIEGDEVIFEFWGTKDGRVATSTYPKISNIVPPPPTKLVETLTLAPGKKKCTETAHAGATAEFTYSVTYPGGEEKKVVFHSFYRPWQAVCLVGVEKLSSQAPDASSKDEAGTPAG